MNFSTPWFENSWLKSLGWKSSWLKSLGLKGPGLKLGVEKSGVEMSFKLQKTCWKPPAVGVRQTTPVHLVYFARIPVDAAFRWDYN